MEADSQATCFDLLPERINQAVLNYVDLRKEIGADKDWDVVEQKDIGMLLPDGKYIFSKSSPPKLYSCEGELFAEWQMGECWSKDRKYRAILEEESLSLTIYTSEGEYVTGARWIPSGGCLKQGLFEADTGLGSKVEIHMLSESQKNFKEAFRYHFGYLVCYRENRDVCWSSNGECVMVCGRRKSWLKNIKNSLLLQEAPKDLSFKQYLFLLTLLHESFPHYIKESDKETLDSMPEIKKLLCVQKGKRCDRWRLLMKKYTNVVLKAIK